MTAAARDMVVTFAAVSTPLHLSSSSVGVGTRGKGKPITGIVREAMAGVGPLVAEL